MTLQRKVAVAFLLLLVNSGWVWAFPEANLFYVSNVLLHVGLGAALVAALWAGRPPALRELRRGSRPAFWVLSACGATGLILCYVGAIRPNYPLVVAHGAAGFLGAALIWAGVRGKASAFARPLAAALVVALSFPAFAYVRTRWFPAEDDRIVNPLTAPLSMDYEGAGKGAPFFPSASTTSAGGLIPSDFFMDSAACGECHKDVYEQWQGSMHRFSSFNNQFYRKAVEYAQDTVGVEPTKWCAGCHDHAMLFNGSFERPVKEQIDTPQAHAGLGCMSCHSIVRVPDTMGNGGFVIEYPPLHDLLTSESAVVRAIHDYVTNTAPAAHRRAFMKPFMREDLAEYCSVCHKVHLDVPVNGYRWLRGFNEYDSWQASGVSGQGARSFYYPEEPVDCSDCHMPLVESDDPGNIDGFVHSHRFPAANTAVPFINGDEEQLRVTEEFLRSGIVSIDIFAVSPVALGGRAPEMIRRTGEAPRAATSFAVGEEAEGGGGPVILREVGEIAAPIDRVQPRLKPGETVKVDVVVRTRRVGHFFPGGTVDSVDCWVELKGVDALGRTFFWSGRVEDGGEGAVEPGARFYRSVLLDERGNVINKRNASQARSLLYARLIPPGAADVAHYLIRIPEDAAGPVRFEAKLNYRKFTDYYTRFSFAGEPDPESAAEHSASFDDREFTFEAKNIPANISSTRFKDHIPSLPITVLARAEASIDLGGQEPPWKPAAESEDYERWNDYGIGLLLEGDLKGAEYAFKRVTEARPDFADGWLNIARALIEEGQTEAARPHLERALGLAPELPRAEYFYALVHKAAGELDEALERLRRVSAAYPRDRVVLNQRARILFLQRNYGQAIEALDRVARIDPEDLQMHYTRMLCYRGLGRLEEAEREEKLFRRFKADESAQAGTARIRRLSPELNNARQRIHEHVSVELPWPPPAGGGGG